MEEEVKLVSIKNYKATPEQEASIIEHEEKRKKLVEEVRKKWEEKEAAEKQARLDKKKK